MSGCGAFALTPEPGVDGGTACSLLAGAERGLCDPRAAGCVAAAAVAAAVAASGGAMYVRDALGLYCRGTASETCACLREYADCMRRRGCQLDGAPARAAFPVNAAASAGGAAALSPRNRAEAADEACASSPLASAARWAPAPAPPAWWHALPGWEGWWGLVGLCAGAGCTAAQCGLPGPICNQSAVGCGAAYLACALAEVGGDGKCDCLRALTGCLGDAACLYSGGERVDALYAM